MSSPVTLKQIAESTGVSVTTVSRALNGHVDKYRISARTVAAVVEAANKLSFRPNEVARGLRRQRSGLVGVIVPDLASPFSTGIVGEVTAQARQHGYAVLLADSQRETAQEAELLNHLISRQVEGLILCPVGTSSEHLKPFIQQWTPIVQVDRCFLELPFAGVTSDHRQGAYLATRHLLDQGHRRIGCAQGIPGTLPNEERVEGYRQAMREFRVSVRKDWIQGDGFTPESGYAATKCLLERTPELTALFSFNALISLGVMQAAAELGRRIPGDLSLIGFDEPPYVNYLATPLCTVNQDVRQLGRQAFDVLVGQINDRKNVSGANGRSHRISKPSQPKPAKRPRRATIHRVPVEVKIRVSVASRRD